MSNDPHRQKCYILHKEKAEGVIRLAMKKSVGTRVDMLDCSKSFSRQPCDKKPEDVLAMAMNSPSYVHWTFIQRKDMWKGCPTFWEIGCIVADDSTDKYNRVEYFLWVEVSDEDGESIAKEYELKEHK